MNVFSKTLLSFLAGICWNASCHYTPNDVKGQGIVFYEGKLFLILVRSMELCNVGGKKDSVARIPV